MESSNGSDYSMPIGFAMALSTDKASFEAFLSLADDEQLRVLEIARECKTQRERQLLVNSLAADKK